MDDLRVWNGIMFPASVEAKVSHMLGVRALSYFYIDKCYTT